ncbi:MAG: flagellar assembly peptidoglycan hydrolase FlgJ [Herbaspirillum sp.]
MINNIKPGNPAESLAVDIKSLNALRSSAAQRSPEALKGAAKQFEALFLNMMLKSMRDVVPQDGMFESQQTKLFTSMLDQQLSQNMAQRGIGLADMLVRQLSRSLNQSFPSENDAAERLPLDIPLARGLSDLYRARSLGDIANRAYDSGSQGSRRDKNQQRPAHVAAFHNRLWADAEAASRVTGIPAKFMLAQAALETGWGKREIRTRDGSSAHNLFGIKATGNWTGRVTEATTIEYINGVPQRRVEKFRAYDSYAEAFRDYANFLKNNPRYEKVLANARDADGFALGLQRAGYATDPHYAAKLSSIIRKSFSA